jgi:cytosine/creatinine deaminase
MDKERVVTRIKGAVLLDGRTVDVRISGGNVAEVATTLNPRMGEDDIDAAGALLVPAAAEPHAHLDKALTADRVPNTTGDLMGAITAWSAYRGQLTVDDIAERAERAARLMLGNGITAIRTHVDVSGEVGSRGVEALLRVRGALAGLVDVQIVALVAAPTTGLAGSSNRAALRDAMQAGADVVGGCPHLDPEPDRCQRYCLELAGELGRPIDLHTDEHTDPSRGDLRSMADWVKRTGFRWGVTASHCVSLGMQDPATQAAVAAEVAEAGIHVIALPQTNLFLQGRDHATATPRGLTALRALLDAGVNVAAGADNLQDPFNTMGRGDPCETAALLVMAGHLLPAEAWHAVSAAARQAMGLPTGGIEVGQVADLVLVKTPSLREFVAFGPPQRVVLRAGKIVAG